MRPKPILIAGPAGFPKYKSAIGKVEQIERTDQLHHLQVFHSAENVSHFPFILFLFISFVIKR